MCRQIFYPLVLVCWCALSTGCVAYMEHQAASSQTGDPSAGGYFGYNQDMADARLASMQAERDSARQAARGTAREVSVLRGQYVKVQEEFKQAKTNANREALAKELNEIRETVSVSALD
jgi:hypothetical protein